MPVPTYPGWIASGGPELPVGSPAGPVLRSGKVRDIFEFGEELLISTTDRVSAFDRILALVPHKGEVLNRISLYWFNETCDIIPNHIVEPVTARTVRARRCRVLPVEVVVRGYLTGSAWRDYRAGRPVSGIELPPGMRFNEKFAEPLLTPSTKEELGLHDRPVSTDEIVGSGLVPRDVWARVETAAIALYRRGMERSRERGLILVDTKYEFGLLDGELLLVDEVHTPDSSRYWYADSYDELFEAGARQRQMDKEYLRNWLSDHGFTGEGSPPEIPGSVLAELSRRYITTFEEITGTEFRSQALSAEAEREKIMYVLSGGESSTQ
ncbi:phosphoribosylaminoimidazolesuccinocarboxamide synthase [Salinispira pacifica]